MADVYLARTKGLEDFQRDFAIKRILQRFAEDQRSLRMFLDEARITVALQHPNIVQVFDLGESRSDYFIVMEYVDGMDLRRLIKACTQASATFPYKHTLYIVTEALKALSYAHAATGRDGEPLNVVHQDISPANIMVARSGAVKLTDFGVARAAIAKWESDPNELLGKFRYFAPELVQGGQPSVRSDTFAVGAVLYELVTGEPLLLGADFDEVRDELCAFDPEDALDRDLSIPTALEPILVRALASHPSNRYASADEFLDDLTDHVFEDRIRISGMDLARFIALLEATVTSLGQQQEMEDDDPPSLTLELIDEPPAGIEADDEDDEEDTERRTWRFPDRKDADVFVPGSGPRQCDAGVLRAWAVDGHVGFDTLVHFEGDHWRPLWEFLEDGSTGDRRNSDRLQPIERLRLRRQIAGAVVDDGGVAATFFTGAEVVSLHLRRGRLLCVEGTDDEGGLIGDLRSAGLLSHTQAMVIEHLAGTDQGKAAEAVVARKLVEPERVHDLVMDRLTRLIGRVLDWPCGSLLLQPLAEPGLRLSSIPFDELLAEVLRRNLPAADLAPLFHGQLDEPFGRDPTGPQPLPIALQEEEIALLQPGLGGTTLSRLLAAGHLGTDERAYRSVLLLLQFGLLRFMAHE